MVSENTKDFIMSQKNKECMLISVIPPVCTWERMEVCRPAVSAPLMELERDSVGVDEAACSTVGRITDFRS